MPWPAQEIYAAVVEGSNYVVTAGGLVGTDGGIKVLDGTAIFDGGRWTPGPRLPRPTHHPAMAHADGRVFAFGGYVEDRGGQWSATKQVLALRTSSRTLDGFGDHWIRQPDMPAPQSETVALTHRGRVHLITGRAPRGESNAEWADQIDTDAHRVFDPDSNRWTTARPAPEARNSAAGAVIRDRLYLVGGRTVGGGNLARLDRYDPHADRWETLRPMPQASAGLAAVAAWGRLYVMGGEWFRRGEGSGVFAEVWEYDPAGDSWRAVAPMRTPRHGLAAVNSGGNRIIALGGATRSSARGTSAVVEVWEA